MEPQCVILDSMPSFAEAKQGAVVYHTTATSCVFTLFLSLTWMAYPSLQKVNVMHPQLLILDSMPPLQRQKRRGMTQQRQNLLCFLFFVVSAIQDTAGHQHCFLETDPHNNSMMEPQYVILDSMPSYSEAKNRGRGITQRRHLVFLLS